MKLLLLSSSLGGNDLGRTFCLWSLARSLGWDAVVASVDHSPVWEVLSNTEFAGACCSVNAAELRTFVNHADLLIICKPVKESLGLALQESLTVVRPVLVDVDDPDVEVRLFSGSRLRRAGRLLLRSSDVVEQLRLRHAARRLPTICSNPWLQSRYGGTVVPHVRNDPGPGRPHVSTSPTVAFVGTNREHKGLPDLRRAVALCQTSGGYTLKVTDTPPDDAAPWEVWTAQTTFAEGLEIVRTADVVVIPSRNHPNALGQLPVKLIDAMLAARAVAVTDLEPLPWALNRAGVVVQAGNPDQLAATLEAFRQPLLRSQLGAAARNHGLASYTVEAVAPAFAEACNTAVRSFEK